MQTIISHDQSLARFENGSILLLLWANPSRKKLIMISYIQTKISYYQFHPNHNQPWSEFSLFLKIACSSAFIGRPFQKIISHDWTIPVHNQPLSDSFRPYSAMIRLQLVFKMARFLRVYWQALPESNKPWSVTPRPKSAVIRPIQTIISYDHT